MHPSNQIHETKYKKLPSIYPICYFPPIPWFAAAFKEEKFVLEVAQHFRKQQYTNRMQVKISNRILPLTIPIQRRGAKTPIRDKKISYTEDWQKQHWRTLVSAYQASPYFMYYEDRFRRFYEDKPVFLMDLLTDVLNCMASIIDWEPSFVLSDEYHPTDHYTADYRQSFDPSAQSQPDWFISQPYPQVFEGAGFTPGLSMIDLIFNEGPTSRSLILQSVDEEKWQEYRTGL